MKLMPFKNESLLNFATEEARKKMMGALESVRRDFGKVYSLHTAESLSNSSRPVIKSVNPANPSQIIGSVESADLADAETALKTVTEGSKTWRRTPAEKRIQLTMDLAKWMEDRRYELAAWMVYEVGKNWREADADVCEAIDFCRYYAQETTWVCRGSDNRFIS
jgi:delta 1-pyrroline-5-carboxylate dehydrogenase